MPLDGNRHRDNKGLPSRSMTLGVESPKTRRMMFQRSRSGIEHHDGEVDCLNSPPTTRQNSSSDPANYLSGSREDEDSDNEDKAVPASDGVTDVLDEDEVDRTSKGVSFSTAVAEVRVRSLSVESDETSNRNEAILNAAEHMAWTATTRNSVRRNSAKRLQRLASMPGDTELHEYIDGLAKEPEKLITPHNMDTGETILHLLAKEGKVEILRNLLEDPRMESELVKALLRQDKLGWNPIMAAMKADSGGEEMIEMFIAFLVSRLDQAGMEKLLMSRNIAKDTIFTLLMRATVAGAPTEEEESNLNSRKLLFSMIIKNSLPDEDKLHRWVITLVQQLLTPNSCDLTSRSMRDIINLLSDDMINDSSPYAFERLFAIKDEDGNNLLMELARNMKDDALREILTNTATTNNVTHSILLTTNNLGQTLLTLIEVNRESLSESLPLVLKREYGCHRRDMIKTEMCLSDQLETSASASEIIQELHQLEPKTCCQIFVIWVTLFLTSLTPNIGLAVSDIFSDAYLTVEYHSQMMNNTYVEKHAKECMRLKNMTPIPLQAYAACLDSKSQFCYTITFLLVPLVFYLTEFLTLRPEYEPTGFRQRLQTTWKKLRNSRLFWSEFLLTLIKFAFLTMATMIALVLWQPVTAMCKFYRDARYEASEGTTKVIRRKEKRFVDLAASRGELIEVSIEAVFEPMVQGYIIFPSIISIIQRLANSVTVADDGTLRIDFQLRGMETAQIFSICISMVSLAWCFSEYNSVRKNMLLDITVSPCSRFIMCLYMLLQVVARLLAFMLFTLYWGPGNFYPLMIFVAIHMIIAACLHVFFSEDYAFWKKGHYVKFIHNVMMNSFATIYFHNYLRFDEMPAIEHGCQGPDDEKLASGNGHKLMCGTFDEVTNKYEQKIVDEGDISIDINDEGQDKDKGVQFIDTQRPGLHISTFLRQLTFDVLYTVEYAILLSFGFSSDVKDLIDQKRRPILVSVIIVLSMIALSLKLFYYFVIHVWSRLIVTGKKLIRQEIKDFGGNQENVSNLNGVGQTQGSTNIQSRFFKYVFISRNTWILGKLKHIETTVIVLPKKIIEAIKGRGQDLEYNFTDVGRQVQDRSWSSPRSFFKTQQLQLNNLILSFLFFPIVILVIVINVLIIILLLIGLVLTIPVAILVFLYNLKSGFRAVEMSDGEEEGQNTLELPPVEGGGDPAAVGGVGSVGTREKSLFNSYPGRTLSSIQKNLEDDGGVVDLSKKPDITADEFEVFTMLLLSLNRKKYPLKRLHLDNCDITDEKLSKLAPLIIKFEKVTLNGSQKMTAVGWEELRATVCNMSSQPSSVKLRKLELKITKNDEDVIRFRREVLLEELKRTSMTSDALAKIGQFIPRLEKVYLDDIFSDSSNLLDLIKQTSRSSDEIVEAWKSVARSIMCCRVAKRKLRCLSLPGCAINDEILAILAPALVTVKMVHLGRNPITFNGWETFKNFFLDEDAAVGGGQGGAGLTHLSLNAITDGSGVTGGKLLLHAPGMEHLSKILPRLEEVDLSGQCEVGADGWASFCTALKVAREKDLSIKLHRLTMKSCNLKDVSREMIEDAVAKYLPSLKIDFGEENDQKAGSKKKKMKGMLCV